MMAKHEIFDHVIAGGGCAGLSLAYFLSLSNLSHEKILILDRDQKDSNDRTWCFWSNRNEPFPFRSIISKCWNVVQFADQYGIHESPLQKLDYNLIRGLDYYDFIKNHLRQFPNIEFRTGQIKNITSNGELANVYVDDQIVKGRWAYDSVFQKLNLNSNHHNLYQHFKGWIIETKEDCFDPEKFMLMDFRVFQGSETRFFYILPLSSKKALVEFTVFSKSLLSDQVYDNHLELYIADHLGIKSFEIKEREFGVIPMTDAPFQRSFVRNIIPVGTPAGAVKPTTGFAFKKIVQSTQEIVHNMEQNLPPNISLTSKNRFRFYDKLLLNILSKEGHNASQIFSHLFRSNSAERIFTFLEEKSNIFQEGRIFARLPWYPFFRAIYRTQFQIQQNDVKVPVPL